jgi:tocopherol O-methyltransferase
MRQNPHEKSKKEHIIRLYDYGSSFYRYFGKNDPAEFAIHYGMWGKNIKSPKEAVIYANKYLAKKSGINSGDHILDAGCGVGGSCLWLALTYKVKVTGISVSQKEIDKAQDLTRKFGVTEIVEYKVMDYSHTDFPDSTFDVVWAQESLSYAENKKEFAKEAFRVLKKNGRLVVADVSLAREPDTPEEKKWIKTFLEGFALPSFIEHEHFQNSLKETGFYDIELEDNTQEVMPTARSRYTINRVSYPIAKLTAKLRLTPEFLTENSLASKIQYNLLRDGVLKYIVISANK